MKNQPCVLSIPCDEERLRWRWILEWRRTGGEKQEHCTMDQRSAASLDGILERPLRWIRPVPRTTYMASAVKSGPFMESHILLAGEVERSSADSR